MSEFAVADVISALPANHHPHADPELPKSAQPIPYEVVERVDQLDRLKAKAEIVGENAFALAIGGTVLGSALEVGREEIAQSPWLGNAHDLLTRAAEAGPDWKAWTGVIGAVGISRAAMMIKWGVLRRKDRQQEIDNLMAPDTPERRRARWAKRIGGVATMVISGTASYKYAEHASMLHVFATNTIGLLSAEAGLLIAKRKADKHDEKTGHYPSARQFDSVEDY